jgi:hypothetical protein
VIDSLIPFNFRFHNTTWVVAHFHTYLLMCVVFWAFAFLTHLLEQGSGATARRERARVAIVLMVVGGYGLTGTWFVEGVLGVPRRYQLQPPGTSGYSLVGSIFVMVFALGFLVFLVEVRYLWRLWQGRRWTTVRRMDSWTGGSYRVREPAAGQVSHESVPELRVTDPPLRTGLQFAFGVALTVIGLLSFAPQVIDASETSTRWHHLDHSGHFFFGAMLALVLCSLPRVHRWLGDHPNLGLATVLGGSTAMLLLMVPSIYEPLEPHSFEHALFHVGMAALGFVTGIGASRLGPIAGRAGFVLSVGMTLWFAAAMTGG